MSLESLNSNFQSDESDDEASKNMTDEDSEEVYAISQLFNGLLSFEHIYENNAVIDMEVGHLQIIQTDCCKPLSTLPTA